MIFLHSYDRNRVIINIMTNVDYRKLWKLLIDKGIKNKTHIRPQLVNKNPQKMIT